jgi:hypothetical protein
LSEKNVYRVRLLRWGDSSSSGRTVTFKLPDDEEDHPFKGLDVGSKNGQLLEMEIAIYDGEGDIETLGRVRKPRARIMPALPVVSDDKSNSRAPEPGRRAILENVSRRVIKSGGNAHNAPPPTMAPHAEPQHTAPVPATPMASTDESLPPPQNSQAPAGGNLDANNFDAYANQMGQAAEALAAVAERLDDQVEDDSQQFPTMPSDAEDNLDPGIKAVRRAFDLCKAIDKQRAGFYYFMRSRYPEAPKLPGEDGDWSRDAKTTRDRVCLHCDATKLNDLAQDDEARKKFEELENEFERHERLR